MGNKIMIESNKTSISNYSEIVGADTRRLENVFRLAIEVADIVRKSNNKKFTTTAFNICKHFGFNLEISTDETLRHLLGLTMQTADGSTTINLQGLSEDMRHRFVFYHELAHSLFHMSLLKPPDVTPDKIIDISEAEAWLFSVVCAANPQTPRLAKFAL
ncbi:MAG: hypothetical protein KKB94_11720 [Proteobacteria bacterium]|nr:hypothetical protein [Pseudomonadota bacterium]